MKKLSILFVVSLMVTSFDVTKEEKEVLDIPIKKQEIEIKKEYYVSVVPYVNHDDYFQIKNSRVSSIENAVAKTNESIIINNNSALEKEDPVIEVSNNNQEVKEFKTEQVKEEQLIENINSEVSDILVAENKEEKLITEEVTEEKTIDTNNITEEKRSGYYSLSGKYLGDTKVKVIDVSEHQGIIDWDKFVNESDCYGVILRIGYYDSLDKQFERNISELKRLNIPYGIYLFSYSSTINGAIKESNFTNRVINEYNLNPILGIYYDIESWSTKYSNSNNISKSMYDDIVTTYVNNVKSNIGDLYQIGVYSGRWYAMNRLGSIAKSYVNWVAEYNSICLYDGNYKMWQYTSKGTVPGINGNVDINYWY